MQLISTSFIPLILIVIAFALQPSFGISAPPPGDLELSNVEVVQVVLGPRGLIAEKPATFKLTIQSTFTNRKYVAVRVNYNSGDTYLDRGGSGSGIPIDPGENVVYVPGGPSFPASPEPWIDEGTGPYLVWNMDGSGDFVQVTIDAEGRVAETDETNNTKSFFVDVFHTAPMRVLIAPVALPDQEDWEIDTGLIERQRQFMQETYPIPDLLFDYRALWRTESTPTPTTPGGHIVDEDWFYSNVVLPLSTEADLLGYDRLVVVHTNDYWKLSFCGSAMGMLREPQNRLPVVIVSDDFRESNYCLNSEKLIAHEIGHTYFLWHPFSTLFRLPVSDSQEYSVTERTYDVRTKTFMEYDPCCLRYAPSCPWTDPLCGLPVPWWIDDQRYQEFPKTWVDCSSEYPIAGTYMWNLWDQFVETPLRMKVLALRGSLFKDKMMFVQSYRFQGRPHINPQDPPPQPPYYRIELLGGKQEVLAEYPFKASFEYALELDFTKEVKIIQTDVIPFHINVPHVEGTTRIRVRDPQGNVLGSKAASPNPPDVALLYPSGGEVLLAGSEVRICWQGQDKDGDELTYLLAYSKNGGGDWIPIASNLNETCHDWNTKGLPSGKQYKVKVIATDGVNTEEDGSDKTFSLVKPVAAKVDIKPDTINLKTKGQFTASLSLPKPYSVKDIDVSTVVCEGAPAVSGKASKNTLTVKFDKKDLTVPATGGTAVFRVTGTLKDGTPFEGSDTVKLIRK